MAGGVSRCGPRAGSVADGECGPGRGHRVVRPARRDRSGGCAVGPIKQRDRGLGAGELLCGIAAAQLAGEDFLTGLDRQRADVAGQQITPVPGLASTTTAGLARRITPRSGMRSSTAWRWSPAGCCRCCRRRGPRRWPKGRSPSTWTPPTWRSTAARNAAWPITTRASGSGGRTWRPGPRPRSRWPPTWATAPMTRARPRRICCAARWPPCRRGHGLRGGWRCAPTPGYFAGQLARAAHDEHISFAIGAKRIAPLWRLLAGLAEDAWHDAIDMDGAQVAVAEYCPDWWPADTRLLIRRVACWTRPRSRPTRGPGAAAPCTRTSVPCRSPSWPAPGRSTPTRSS